MYKKASELLDEMWMIKKASQYKLKPLHCQQCGYEGPPTRKGFCPNCMAICGVAPSAPYKKPEKELDVEPINGNSVEDQWMKDVSEINGYMA